MIRRFQALGLAALVVMAGTVLAQSPPALAQTSEIGFQAYAFGSQVNVGSTVKSGRSAFVVLPCTPQVGVTRTNTVADVNASPLLTSGTVDTTAASAGTTTGVASTASATVQNASLLGGLVSVTTVRSVSTSNRNSTNGAFSTSAAGTEFTGLSVDGIPIIGMPAPNTRISLPGVGYVILNQQYPAAGPGQTELTVIGIHLVVTVATPLAPIGTSIIVADAFSGLAGPVEGLLSGLAYGTNANVAKTIIAGQSFPEYMPCLGTNGTTRTNSGAAVDIPGILTSGTVTDTANGTATATSVSGEMSSTVQNLNLVSGLVTATALKADVTAAGNPATLGDHSSFLGLEVAGFPRIGDTPPPNTKLTLAGIGTLWLHRVFKTTTSITVIMVQLVVTVSGNPLGLAVGTTVNVAYARVGIS